MAAISRGLRKRRQVATLQGVVANFQDDLEEARALVARRRFHRFIFCAAGIYNIAWGLYSVWDPQWLFRYSGLPLQNHPQIFACLAMVVGLYGIIYFEVARVPERGWLLAAVGLTGKVLGPIGLFQLIWSGAWPRATIVLSLTNDLIWWIPFAIYLYDAWPAFRRDVFNRNSGQIAS